jgi:hypothetical protein
MTPLISTLAPDGVLAIVSVSAREDGTQRHNTPMPNRGNCERDVMRAPRKGESTQRVAEITIHGYTCLDKGYGVAVGGISLAGEYATQEMTGRRGYFRKLGSTVENWHMMKTDPRSDSMRRAWRHREHRPGSIF